MSVDVTHWTSTTVEPPRVSSTQAFVQGLLNSISAWRPSVQVQLQGRPPNDLLQQISTLLSRPADLESGFVPPSIGAGLRALVLLMILGDAPPVTGLSDDGEGGLEVYWTGPSRHVQLNVPSDLAETPTVFWDSADGYRLEPLTSPDQLAHRLRWFGEE